MSFTDPFNRVSRKKDREYQLFHEKLKQAGFETEEEVKAVFQKSPAYVRLRGQQMINQYIQQEFAGKR